VLAQPMFLSTPNAQISLGYNVTAAGGVELFTAQENRNCHSVA